MSARFLSGIADFSYCMNKWRYRSMSDGAIFDELESLGAKAFQLDFLFNHDNGAANRAEIHGRAQAAGIVLTGAEYGQPSKEVFERQIAAAKELDMTVIRHAFQPFIGLQERLPLDQLEAALQTAAEAYAGTGLKFALENHQDYRSDELASVFAKVGSPDIGVFLDTGNSLALLEEPVHTAQILAPYVFGVHLKEYVVLPGPGGFHLVGVPMGAGVVDNVKVLQLIADKAPAGTIPVLLENPLERCRVNLFGEAYVRIMGGFALSELGPIACLIEKSQSLFPEGVTLPFEDPELTPEAAQEAERQHNRLAYRKQVELLSAFA